MLTQDNKETEREVKLSMERIIDLVREVRNGLIVDLLNDDNLFSYFHKHYEKDLSQVRAEFLKRDLSELRNSPVDLSHYGMLIKQMQEHNTASITSTHQELFYRELETIFKKYSY
jgi:hypothetical protein